MEQAHPIPQDVTGFQFKLIGNMTIKQFLYLAAGSVVGWIFFASGIFAVIKIPLSLLSFFIGFSLAFIPIEGRPMDTMLFLFIKALFTPNQYVYEKAQQQPPSHIPITRAVPVASPPLTPPAAPIQKSPISFNTITTPAPQIISSFEATKPPVELPPEHKEDDEKAKELKKELEKEENAIKQELTQAKQVEEEQKNTKAQSLVHEKVIQLESQLQETLSQKQELEQELITLQKKLEAQKEVFTPSQAENTEPVAKQQTTHAKVVPKTMSKSIGLIVPDVPNILTGVVKDSRGNVLPNILVEVKTPEGESIRAFKTNVLGQFASAMPLANDTYTIEFTDPNQIHSFDAIEIIASGEIILPLEITSVDKREELRRTLFANQSTTKN